MKKPIKIIIIIIAILIGTFIGFILAHNASINDIVITSLSNKLDTTYNYLTKYNYGNTGTIDLTANYKGAHGESNPSKFAYNVSYSYDTSAKVTFTSDAGYYDYSISSNLLDLYYKIKGNKLDDYKSLLIDSKRSNNKFIIDSTKFNELFNTNYSNITIEYSTKGLISSIDTITINMDNDYLKLSNDLNTINGSISSNTFKIVINSSGYSYTSDTLKMNVFLKDDVDTYNIVYGNYSLTINAYDNKIEFNVNGESAIYKGLEFTLNFANVDITKTTLVEENSIPILRYINNLKV